MGLFSLPSNSKVLKGRVVDASQGAARPKTFKIYRWSQDDHQNPRMDEFKIDLACCGAMVLDALLYIKDTFDPTLAFRRSCREGVCGSCAMNINGINRLACTTPIEEFESDITIYPLPHLDVKRDLVADLEPAYAQYTSVQPWLQNEKPLPDRERLQSPEERAKLDGLWECILCFCCTTACPSYWWNGNSFLGPAILLQAFRWIEDTRDTERAARLEALDDNFKLYRCHTILNCTRTCPKNLNPGKAAAGIKSALIDAKDKE